MSSRGRGSNEKISPSVFERLSRIGKVSPLVEAIKDSETDPNGNKRRRLSRSDERRAKKAKLGEDSEMETPSVFERLGVVGRGSGGRNSGDKNHYVQVTSSASNRSAQRMVLESGKIVEEGLMVNSNPSKQL